MSFVRGVSDSEASGRALERFEEDRWCRLDAGPREVRTVGRPIAAEDAR